MRLLLLNRSFWPDQEATGQRLTELCEDLSAEHQITVVAGPSNFGGAARRPFRLWAKEYLKEIRIIRTWGTRFPKRRLPLRLLNLGSYFSFAALASLTTSKPDVIIAATDPPLLGALGAALKRWWGCTFVYNVRDLYPDIAIANGGVKSHVLLKLLEWANNFAYTHADLLIVLGEDMRRRVLGKGVSPDKVVVVSDNIDCEQLRTPESNPLRAEYGDRFVVIYSGNLGLSQQLETVVEAAAYLRDDRRILFLLVGHGAREPWLRERVRCLELQNVQFRPYLPKERLAESLSAADLHLVTLLGAATGASVPSKVYGILAAGRPYIAMMGKDADAAVLAQTHQVGFTVSPGNAEELALTIRRAASIPGELNAMGIRARRLAEQCFDRKVVARKFIDALLLAIPADGNGVTAPVAGFKGLAIPDERVDYLMASGSSNAGRNSPAQHEQ
jgi:colanic acid biosynthesis glycosyl transferase WcaI